MQSLEPNGGGGLDLVRHGHGWNNCSLLLCQMSAKKTKANFVPAGSKECWTMTKGEDCCRGAFDLGFSLFKIVVNVC